MVIWLGNPPPPTQSDLFITPFEVITILIVSDALAHMEVLQSEGIVFHSLVFQRVATMPHTHTHSKGTDPKGSCHAPNEAISNQIFNLFLVG